MAYGKAKTRGNYKASKNKERSSRQSYQRHSNSNLNSESDSDSGPPEEINIIKNSNSDSEKEEEDFFDSSTSRYKEDFLKKKKNKHAPKETKINHKPVSVVRDIPGLEIKRDYTGDGSVHGLYTNRDVRFDTALGKSIDYEVVRKQYSFLDKYRETEIKEMENILKNKKMLSRMNENEIEELKYKLQSTKSKLESLKKKDREREALKKYMKDQKKENGGKFLTRAEKRKVVLVDRFESMNSKQKNKSIERKRKRKLGKEMRAMEFRGN